MDITATRLKLRVLRTRLMSIAGCTGLDRSLEARLQRSGNWSGEWVMFHLRQAVQAWGRVRLCFAGMISTNVRGKLFVPVRLKVSRHFG